MFFEVKLAPAQRCHFWTEAVSVPGTVQVDSSKKKLCILRCSSCNPFAVDLKTPLCSHHHDPHSISTSIVFSPLHLSCMPYIRNCRSFSAPILFVPVRAARR